MADANEELMFNSAFLERVKRLREEKDWTAERMANVLGVPAETYRKYESRSPLPQYLIPRFAAVVDRSVEFILTGHDPPKPPQTPTRGRRVR